MCRERRVNLFLVTVPLLKSCIYWRSSFIIPGYHYNPPVFTNHFTWCHDVPIKNSALWPTTGHLRRATISPLCSPEVGELRNKIRNANCIFTLTFLICSVARRPPASEDGWIVALSLMATFLAAEQILFMATS